MSKIRKELEAATEVTAKRGEDPQAYIKRLAKAVGELDDKAWDATSVAAQDWYNSVCDAAEAGKPLPDFPDAEKDEDETKPARRGAAKAEEAEAPASAPKKGDKVKVVNKRGKTYEGVFIEEDDDVYVVNVDDEEIEINKAGSSIEVVGGAKSRRKSEEEDDEPAGPVDPQLGDTVQVTTSRDKVVMGKVIEIDDDVIVLKDTTDEEHEFTIAKLKSVVVKVSAKAAKKAVADAEEKPATRRGAAKAEEAEAPKRAGKGANGGVSVTNRARELIVEDFDLSKEDLLKALRKEGLEFRENTIDMIYAETHKLIGMMKEAGKLKK